MIVQGSAEWHQIRCGKVTASRIADLMAKTKTGWGASRKNYMAELVAERLTGTVAPSYTNAAMQHGIDTEADARLNYEFQTNATVELVGFDLHPTIGHAGASPDGLVGEVGLVEFKCPATATHIETLLGGTVPERYVLQTQWQMACRPEREWCDFVSFDDRLPEAMRLFIQRVERDDAKIAELEKEVIDFLAELQLTVHRLRSKYEPEAVTPGELLLMAG